MIGGSWRDCRNGLNKPVFRGSTRRRGSRQIRGQILGTQRAEHSHAEQQSAKSLFIPWAPTDHGGTDPTRYSFGHVPVAGRRRVIGTAMVLAAGLR